MRPYNYERVHSGYGMEGRTPYECCVALGFTGSAYVGLMLVVLWDEMVLDWSRADLPAVNDVLAHYTPCRPRPPPPAARDSCRAGAAAPQKSSYPPTGSESR